MKFSKQGKDDRTQYLQVRIKVPLWVFKPFEWVGYQFRKLAYQLKPDRCSCCNKKMYTRNMAYTHTFDNGRRLEVSNTCQMLLCRECIIEQLTTKDWQPRFTDMSRRHKYSVRNCYRYWTSRECAITNESVRSYKDVEIVPYIDMIFCTNAWNHDYISQQAVIESVQQGTSSAYRWGIYKKKMMPMNHKGLFLDDQGKLA